MKVVSVMSMTVMVAIAVEKCLVNCILVEIDDSEGIGIFHSLKKLKK